MKAASSAAVSRGSSSGMKWPAGTAWPLTVPAHSVVVLKHQDARTDGYSNYKRVP